MKNLLICLILAAGCASPAVDYVMADKATHDQLKPYIAHWIATDASLDAETKEALTALDQSWTARTDHAIAQIKSG